MQMKIESQNQTSNQVYKGFMGAGPSGACTASLADGSDEAEYRDSLDLLRERKKEDLIRLLTIES